ncbi:tetratricopeptide (TPR) repeat protein [Janthinobacterium sp. CG_23.3]|uniref:hypothetical protein n=1 Tax=Janthinobacterium sp. CG_23.3 TaxID=3349634 RepID=UPI0038D41C59
MKLHTLLPGLASMLLLAACAATDGARPAPAATLEHTLGEADAAAKSGQYDKAQALLKGAGNTFPADKGPWLQLAQMKFERTNYGDAISNALEALQRDPEDKLANSIVAASGLRLSTKALTDLTRQNNLNGSLRSEAQELSKLLRTSLGEDVQAPQLGSGTAGRRQAAVKRAGAAAAKSSAQGSGVDPFGGLGK